MAQIENEPPELPQSTDRTTVYTENPREFTKMY